MSQARPPRRPQAIAVTSTRQGPELTLGPLTILGLLLLIALWFAMPARAAESPSQLEMPTPANFLSPDSISFAVLHARPDDEGFKQLLDTAWQGLKANKSNATSGFMGILLRVIQGNNSNGLISFLPLQMVRVDSLDPETALPHPTFAVTVAGWGGLQTPLYFQMSRGKDGKPFPTKDLEDATLVLREGWKDPTRSHILTRMDGTFVSFPTLEKAESTVKKLAAKTAPAPQGEIASLLPTLDTSRDTYGALLNRKGSMQKFLSWLNKADMRHAEQTVGKERMDTVLTKVKSMTWEGDLVSDDEMAFLLRFRTDSPEARKELATLLKDVREVLDGYGRAGEMRTSGIGSELQVHFTMVGYRDMLTNYVNSSI